MASSSDGSLAATSFCIELRKPSSAPSSAAKIGGNLGSRPERAGLLAGLRECVAHESADPTRSENRMSLSTPLQFFAPHSIQPPQGPKECDAQNRKEKDLNSATAVIAR